MSDLLRLLENEVQLVALSFMALVYVLRLVWIFRFMARKERARPVGSRSAGVALSMMNVAMPWAMESVRRKPVFYTQFVVFHIGVAAGIAATFIIPYWPELFRIRAVAVVFQVILGAAFIVGLMRLYRRLVIPSVKLISTLDDFFSLVLLVAFFAAGFLAVPSGFVSGEWPLIVFFGLTAFILVYVPFSKICHYLYYPFTRYFLGKSLGHRGVVAKKKQREGSK